jgi:cell division protein FtsB
MFYFIVGIILIVALILVGKKIRNHNRRYNELENLDNFNQISKQIDTNIELVDRQEVLIDKVNKLKEKRESVESKIED